ncbi:hypothetical protein ES708_19655 [subsurface metagenome]
MRYLFSSTEIAVEDALKSIEIIDGRAKETLMTTAEKLVLKISISNSIKDLRTARPGKCI